MVVFRSLVALSLSLAAMAGPLVAKTDSGACNTGTLQCCNSSFDPTSTEDPALAGLLGIVVGPLEGLVGLHCTSILGSTNCNQQTVCCTGNSFNGLVAVGCTPVNLNVL